MDPERKVIVRQDARVDGHDVILTLTNVETGEKMGTRVYRDLHRYVQGIRGTRRGRVMLIAIPESAELEFEPRD